MDDLSISGDVVSSTLRELDTINTWLGGNAISLRLYKRLAEKKKSISLLDMGTGGGDLMKMMVDWSRKNKIETQMKGIDANPHIIDYAVEHLKSYKEINFLVADVFDPSMYTQKVDVIHACLFTHHFSHEQLVWLFTQWKNTATTGVIINDLQRHPLAYYSIKILTRLFSKSYMVRNDAALSVARGFKRRELIQILKEAGITTYQLRWKWAFRWSISF